MIKEDAINVYTDGSSYSNPRKGGLAVRIIVIDDSGNEQIEDIPFCGYKSATNNAMELLACINGLKEAQNHLYFHKVNRICIFTDSLYVVNNYEIAIFQWSKQGWRNQYKRPVDNADLWKKFLKIFKSINKRIEINWVKGHSKNIHNKAVDKQAKKSAKGFLNPEIKIQKVRRKKAANKTVIGSIKPEGQRISLYIITDEYLRVQKCYKYRCQVISKKSKYFNMIDFIYSELLLNAGHSYSVRLNNDPNYPKIVKFFKEYI